MRERASRACRDRAAREDNGHDPATKTTTTRRHPDDPPQQSKPERVLFPSSACELNEPEARTKSQTTRRAARANSNAHCGAGKSQVAAPARFLLLAAAVHLLLLSAGHSSRADRAGPAADATAIATRRTVTDGDSASTTRTARPASQEESGRQQDARLVVSPFESTRSKDRNVIQSTAFNGRSPAPGELERRDEGAPSTSTATTTTTTSPRTATTTLAGRQLTRRRAPSETSKWSWSAPLLEYHLSQLGPPSLVPTSVQLQRRQQLQQRLRQQRQVQVAAGDRLAPSPTPTWRSAENNRTGPQADQRRRVGDPDLMTSAASLAGPAEAADAAASGLVHMQLPLQLHLKLKPLALPMPPPPPPSVRQQQALGGGLGEAKRRRSLDANSSPSAAGTATITSTTATTTTTSAPRPGVLARHKTAGISKRHSRAGDPEALTWQEAKRVLLINSLAPPLVQAAHRVLQRRHSLFGSPRDHSAAPVQRERPAVKFRPANATSAAPPSGGPNRLDGELLKVERTKQLALEQFIELTTAKSRIGLDSGPSTAFSSAPLSQARAGRHSLGAAKQQIMQGRHENPARTPKDELAGNSDKRSQSMYQIELNNDLLIGAASVGQKERAAFSSEEEARMQQMAAAMLPFVWPSFQLTAGQSLAKLRARSAPQARQAGGSTSTTASPPVAPTWPMKYQQLERNQKAGQTSAGGNAAASEFRAVFADADEDRNRARRLRSLPGPDEPAPSPTTSKPPTMTLIATTASLADATTSPLSSTTPKPVSTRAAQGERRRKKQQSKQQSKPRKQKSSDYLQQQQERLERQRHHIAMKKARAKAAALAAAAAAAAANASSPLESILTTTFASTEGAGDSTRLASSYPLPKIKFNVTSSFAPSNWMLEQSSAQLGEKIAGRARPVEPANVGPAPFAAPAKAQLPKSLSQLIEQQLARAAAANLSSASSATVRQNLLLLQEYLANTQNWSTPMGKLMLAPTTSVSKVVRLQTAEGNQTQTIGQNHQLSSPLASVRSTFEQESGAQRTWSQPVVERDLLGSTTFPSRDSQRFATTSTPPTTTPPPPPTTTTTTTTSTTPKPHKATVDIGSNKISPDDDDFSTTTTTTTTTTTPATENAPTSSIERRHINGRARAASNITEQRAPARQAEKAKQQSSQKSKQSNKWQKSNLSANNENRNIKLFHFKRKPDMAKLPFYKKPLNYTELGWSAEEIEREQRRLLELHQLSRLANGEDPTAESSEIDETDEDEPPRAESVAAAAQKTVAPTELLSLKRKRRARGQFERLMAELQAAAAASGEQVAVSAGAASQADDQRVPVMRKKVEPLVMKPMFFNVNQKRRNQINNATSGELPFSVPTSTTQRPAAANASEASRNKPIVRMRRKEHGEQIALTLEPEPVSTPWRPTKPSWTQSANHLTSDSQQMRQQVPAGADSPPVRLMLVPSGLLTPSGSHPVPLFAATSSRAPIWQAAANAAPAQWAQSGHGMEQASGGLLIAADSSAPAVEAPAPVGGKQVAMMAAANAGGELRVPKLLARPMRPAKYSLNGYIPKPSLNQMQPAPISPAAGLMQAALGIVGPPQTPPSGGGRPQKATRRNQLHPSFEHPLAGRSGGFGKDLDSSTSNEIFSRRRGLEQAAAAATRNNIAQQPSEQLGLGGQTSEPALMSLAANNPKQLLQRQRLQMEENKRKYVMQQQQANSFRSPTLTIQKANQIKAKLGLSAPLNSIRPRSVSSPPDANNRSHKSRSPVWLSSANDEDELGGDRSGAASTNKISALEPSLVAANEDGADENGVQPVAGAYNTIPKTDFECTNKKGQFVAGLFADVKTGCRVWHLCSNNRKYSFLCPTGTIFNSKVNSCDWKHSVRCGPG